MRLSKSESRYRIKFLQENHLNKREQAIFEEEKKNSGKTYKDIYKGYRKGEVPFFMIVICSARLSNVMAKAGISAMQASQAMVNFNQEVEKQEK